MAWQDALGLPVDAAAPDYVVGAGCVNLQRDINAVRGQSRQARVPLREGRTLHHDVIGHYGAGRVIMRTATAGTGVIAGGPMRAIFEALGVQDVVAKSLGDRKSKRLNSSH